MTKLVTKNIALCASNAHENIPNSERERQRRKKGSDRKQKRIVIKKENDKYRKCNERGME